MTFSYAAKRAAIRKAIDVVEHWESRIGGKAYGLDDLIPRLRSIEEDYLQMRLPWEQNANETRKLKRD